jgi:glycosyltransferase involved in cell wall biosynthesis
MRADLLVSVVIPTFRRPDVIVRAVQSVLGQSHRDLEVIVVIDGPNEATRNILSAITDPRLRIIEEPQNVGVARARNIGVANARGRWIAFLDDDDEWLPGKLDAQVEAATRSGGERILMASHYLDKGSSFERVLPYRRLRPEEPLSEFLFCRKGIQSRSGNLQTSTYFVSRLLAQEVPFRPEIRPQEDFDWLLRSAAKADRPFQLLDQPLATYHNEESVGREGAVGDFDFFWSYAHQNRNLFTPRSFSFYLATFCAPWVSASPHPMERWRQVYRGMKSGKMTPRTLFFAAVYATLPMETRRKIRVSISSLISFRRPAAATPGEIK